MRMQCLLVAAMVLLSGAELPKGHDLKLAKDKPFNYAKVEVVGSFSSPRGSDLRSFPRIEVPPAEGEFPAPWVTLSLDLSGLEEWKNWRKDYMRMHESLVGRTVRITGQLKRVPIGPSPDGRDFFEFPLVVAVETLEVVKSRGTVIHTGPDGEIIKQETIK